MQQLPSLPVNNQICLLLLMAGVLDSYLQIYSRYCYILVEKVRHVGRNSMETVFTRGLHIKLRGACQPSETPLTFKVEGAKPGTREQLDVLASSLS